MDTYNSESALRALAEAKVRLAMSQESLLLQDQSLKGLRQENEQLATLIDQMASENQVLSHRIVQLNGTRHLAAKTLVRTFSNPVVGAFTRDREKLDSSIGASFARTETDLRWAKLIADWGRQTEKCREMCRKGVPNALRGTIWRLAIGNDLRLTHQLYYILLNRVKTNPDSFLDPSESVLKAFQDHVTVTENLSSSQCLKDLYRVLTVFANVGKSA